MNRVALVGLFKMDLPGAAVCLADGGAFVWNSDRYSGKDAVWGTLASVDEMSDGIGDELPGARISLNPAASTAALTLIDPANHGARVRFWIGEFDVSSGAIVGNPELYFDGMVDRLRLVNGLRQRVVENDLISQAERLLYDDEGNSLSPRWHKANFPGELGHDNAIDLTLPVPWGAESPPRGATGAGSGGGGFSLGAAQR